MPNKEPKMTVYKSNPILDMKNNMSLYQQRMFNLYLAAINPMKEESRTVKLPLAEFVRLIGIKQVKPQKLRSIARETMGLSVDLYELNYQEGKKKADPMSMCLVHMWRYIKVEKDKKDVWQVEMEASEEILPYLFNLKPLGYLNFNVIKALSMGSLIAEKLYEQCARYKNRGFFTITPEELRARLGIADKASYKSYNTFKTVILARCMKEINEKTDIFVKIAKEERMSTKGKPVKSITFSVTDNPSYVQEKEEAELKALCEKSLPVEIDTDEDWKVEISAADLKDEYGLTHSEAEVVISEMETYSLTADRVREVIEYALMQKPVNRIGYIRTLLQKPDAKLSVDRCPSRPARTNAFLEFTQNSYDFDELEEELLNTSPVC